MSATGRPELALSRSPERREGASRSLMGSWIFIALLSAILMLAAPPGLRQAQAQEPGSVTMQVEAGWKGRARSGHWTPVRIDLNNHGASDVEGELWVGAVTGYGAPVSNTRYIEEVVLPAGGRKRSTLYVPMQTVSQELEVRLVADGRALASARSQVALLADGDLFIGMVGEQAGAYNLLSTLDLPGQRRQSVVVAVPPGALPARPEGLGAFDVIIFGGALDAPVSAQSTRALEAWVAGGGTLVVPARAEGVDLSALPAGLLPARPGDPRQLASATAFEQLGSEPLPEGVPITVVDSTEISGRVLAEQDGLPLVVLGRFGIGRVLYLAFDPAMQPFLSWNGMAKAWETLLLQTLPPSMAVPAGPSSRPPPAPAGQWVYGLYNAVVNLPALEMPSANLLIGLIAGYILLVGPVNFLVLRRLRRATWAWATVPAMVLVFSGGTYFLALEAKGNDVQANTINVVQWTPDTEWAHVRRVTGVFVPSQGDYRVQVPGGGLLSSVLPSGPGRTVRGPGRVIVYGRSGPAPGPGEASISIRQTPEGSQAELRGMGMWSMQALWTESMERAPDRFIADLYIEGDRLKGTVTNGTGRAVEGLWLATGSGAADLGSLAPGGTATVDLPLVDTSASAASDLLQQVWASPPRVQSVVEARQWERLRQAIQGAVGAYAEDANGDVPALLVGWSDNGPIGIEVNGARPMGNALTVLVQPVTPGLRDAFSIPGGMLSARLLSIETESIGSGTNQVIYGTQYNTYGTPFVDGAFTFQFGLPWPDADLDRLAVQVPFDGAAPSQGVELQAYRWDAAAWDTLPLTSVPVRPLAPSRPLPPVRGGPYPYPGPYPTPAPTPTPPPMPTPMPTRAPSSAATPAPPWTATPAPPSIQVVPAVPSVPPGRGWSGSVIVYPVVGVGGPPFDHALEGEVGRSGDPSPYVSPAGVVRVRLVIDGATGSGQRLTLGTPSLVLKGVAHGP